VRVLIVSADLPPNVWSGVGTAVAQQAAALSECGCEVDVLTTAPSGVVQGVPVTFLERDRFPRSLRGRDVIHLHSLGLAELGSELRRRDGSRLVYTAHSLLAWELDETEQSIPWLQQQERLFVDADHVIFVSEREKNLALQQWPVLEGRASVLPNGLGAPLADAVRHPSGSDSPTVMFAGRFCRSKGFDVAVDAMRFLMERNSRVRCVLVGARGREPGTMGDDLARCFPGRCTVSGWLPQEALWRAMERATLLLMPSRYEPFGMIALEAHRIGLPLLCSSAAGWHDPRRPSPAAAMVEGCDPGTWCEKAAEMLDDPGRLQRMRAAGPAFLKAEFNRKRLGRAYMEILTACIRAGSPNANKVERVNAPRTMTACG
jgi:glycosyltransferase involved in cell wall biosynthesis